MRIFGSIPIGGVRVGASFPVRNPRVGTDFPPEIRKAIYLLFLGGVFIYGIHSLHHSPPIPAWKAAEQACPMDGQHNFVRGDDGQWSCVTD